MSPLREQGGRPHHSWPESGHRGIHGALGPGARIGIHANEMTLAELFKQKGYATGMAGKWHLGHHAQFLPTHHGFDEYLGLPYSNDMCPHHPEAKAGTYPKLPLIEGDQVKDPDITPEKQPLLTTWYTERAVKFIERNKERPFFFYLAHAMPHVPLFVSDKFKGKSGAGLFGDVIQEIDWSVGQVLAALKRVMPGLTVTVVIGNTAEVLPRLEAGDLDVALVTLPVPALLLDGLLAISLALAICVFLIALFVETALEYSVFPTVVLVATLLRLSLNVATTRMILLHGADGTVRLGTMISQVRGPAALSFSSS